MFEVRNRIARIQDYTTLGALIDDVLRLPMRGILELELWRICLSIKIDAGVGWDDEFPLGIEALQTPQQAPNTCLRRLTIESQDNFVRCGIPTDCHVHVALRVGCRVHADLRIQRAIVGGCPAVCLQSLARWILHVQVQHAGTRRGDQGFVRERILQVLRHGALKGHLECVSSYNQNSIGKSDAVAGGAHRGVAASSGAPCQAGIACDAYQLRAKSNAE